MHGGRGETEQGELRNKRRRGAENLYLVICWPMLLSEALQRANSFGLSLRSWLLALRSSQAVAAHAIEIAKFEPSSSEHFTIVGCSSSCSLVLPGLVIPLFGSNVTRWPGGSARGRWATVDSKAVLRLASSGYNVILDAVKDWGCDFVAVEGGRLTGNTKEEKDFLAVCQRCIVRVLDGLTRREAEGICEMYGIRGGVGERGSEEGEVEAICFEVASEAHKER